MSKYQALAESDVDGLLNLEKMFLRQWAAICELYDLTLHLIISYNHEKPEGKQLDFILAFCGAREDLANVEQILKGSSLREYFTLMMDSERTKRIGEQQFSAACTLTKRERKIISKPSENSLAQQGEISLYFVPSWEMNEGARLIDMIHMMESLPSNSAYRVDIFPQKLTEKTRDAFLKPITALRQRAGYSDDGRVIISDQRRSIPRDHNAEEVLKQCEDWLGKIDTTAHFQANIYAFGENAWHAQLLLHSAAS